MQQQQQQLRFSIYIFHENEKNVDSFLGGGGHQKGDSYLRYYESKIVSFNVQLNVPACQEFKESKSKS